MKELVQNNNNKLRKLHRYEALDDLSVYYNKVKKEFEDHLNRELSKEP